MSPTYWTGMASYQMNLESATKNMKQKWIPNRFREHNICFFFHLSPTDCKKGYKDPISLPIYAIY